MASELIPADYEQLPEGASFATNLAAGALAGIAEHTLTYPLDAIKTRMQVLHPSPQAIYHDVRHAFRTITGTEGVRALWRGVASVVVGAGPAHAIYFASYEWTKRALVSDPAHDSRAPLKTGAAGAVATTLADAVMTPFDVIKQRMQVHGSVHRGIFDCARQILMREGFGAFYVSYPTTLLLNIPFHCVQFPTYEFIRRAVNPTSAYDPLSHIVAGGAAGALAAAVTCPIDVVKTALQTRGLFSSIEQQQLRSMLGTIRYIYRHAGFRAFFRGVQPRILTFMPSTAICWTTYEYFKRLLNNSDSTSRHQ